jgi:hypothetical protein
MIADTIIRQGEANPPDVVLYVPPDWSLAFPKGEQETTIFLWASETQAQAGADITDIVVTRILPGVAAPAPGVYPAKGHVRSPDAYGPTGTEYIGTDILPVPADVKLDIGYGEDGTEFIGLLSGGDSKLYRWTGTEWISVGTIVSFQ